MKIERMRCHLITVPTRYEIASRYPQHSYAVVEIDTDEGVTGLGYALLFADPGGPAVLRRLDAVVAPALLGAAAGDPEQLWWTVAGLPHHGDTLRIRAQTLAAVDIAVWDIAGKVAGLPLARLWGAESLRVPCYGSGGWAPYSIDDLTAEAGRYLALGCASYKMKVHEPDPAANRARVSAIRSVLGPDRGLMVDANGRLDATGAIELARALENLSPFWFEEPVVADDLTGCAHVARSVPVPVATGENLFTPADFEVLGALNGARYWMPDVCRAGGFSSVRRIAALARESGAILAPHLVPELSAHVVAAGGTGFVEYMDWQPDDLFVGLPAVSEGMVTVAGTPGHGISLARGALERYAA